MLRRRAATLLLATAALLVGACSSGSGSSASSRSSASSGSSAGAGAAPVAEVAARPSAGCGTTPPVGLGEAHVSSSVLDASGAPRWYVRHVPTGYAGATPVPLVVDLHGYSEGADIHTRFSALGPFGDAHHFVTVTPQATGAVPFWDTAAGSADQAFVGHVLDEVEAAMCIDLARVYATGMSNGAMFTSALACTLADRFAAVGAVAGISDPPSCQPARPIPVLAIHGTADQYLAYDGGFGPAVSKLPAPDGSGRTIGDLASQGQLDDAGATARRPSVPDVMAAWAARDGCGPTPAESTVAADVALVRYPCPPGVDVELYRVEGGGHTWPGSAFAAKLEAVVGHTTTSLDADQALWDFFTAHPLPAAGDG